ncbi:hypothetical protein VCCP1035_1500B, partial [Vibrio cholerae CP1035(8)]
KSAVN